MSRPHAAALLEDAWNTRMNQVLASRGWTPRAVGHTGYGSADFVRVLGRVLLSRHPEEVTLAPEAEVGPDVPLAPERTVRGWRAFMTAQLMNSPVVVRVGDVEHETTTDRSGYVDLTVTEHDLRPGGVVEYHMTGPHGETFPGGWEVTAVEEPRHLELRDFFADDDGHRIDSAPISTTTVEITEIEGGEARMVTTSTYDSEQALQTVLDMGAAEGSRLAAGQLDDLLAT